MADLSGVLRKTIDGLPRATPQMRAKVYEKARAAIQRQVKSAEPPLSQDVVEARLSAIEDAIERTERHYQAADAGSAGGVDDGARPEPGRTEPTASGERPAPRKPLPGYGDDAVDAEGRREPAIEARPPAPAVSGQPGHDGRQDRHQDGSRPQARQAAGPGAAATGRERAGGAPENPVFPGFSNAPKQPAREADQPFFPLSDDEPSTGSRPASLGAPFVVPDRRPSTERRPDLKESARGNGGDDALPAGIRSDDEFIPRADVSAPRYTQGRRRQGGPRAGKALAAGIAILILGGIGTAGWLYRDDIQSLLVDPQGLETVATNGADAVPSLDQGAGTDAPDDTTTAADGGTAPAGTPAAGDDGETQAAGIEAAPSTRLYTQRLLPDGTEVDAGPAEPEPNAFGEGTNIAAASPVATGASTATDGTTVSSEIGSDPQIVGAPQESGAQESGPEASTAGVAAAQDAPTAGTEVAAIPPAQGEVPPVAQTALFYQERTETAPGTQETGTVVWSVVNEPPSDGQPAEPAIRAVAEIPEEGLTMTMTIRRNADPTLPASHVIEILFNTAASFDGGGVANVQRLALKSTEQARGEPLIGVAGKISDGFFIIALNNLDEATKSNLTLLRNEQWIDIPIAYATGRRALLSIAKGIPGEQAFNEAIDAWNAKT